MNGVRRIISSLETNTDIIWRGQRNVEWKLETSLNRFEPLHEHGDATFDNYVTKFIAGHAKIDNVKFNSNDRLSWLEYGQHHGLPTPCLDFSFSPYIGLFFVFSGLHTKDQKTLGSLFGLNIRSLAHQYSQDCAKKMKKKDSNEYFHQFLNPPRDIMTINKDKVEMKQNPSDFFDEDGKYPYDKLQFFKFPKKTNARMIRQQGCFLYDTMRYTSDFNNLEDYMNQIEPINEPDGPALNKIIIPLKFAAEVFELLELMNINASLLYMDSTGVAEDVKNSFFYNPRTYMIRE